MFTSTQCDKQNIDLLIGGINIDLLVNNDVNNNYFNILNESEFTQYLIDHRKFGKNPYNLKTINN